MSGLGYFPESLLFISSTKPTDNPSINSPLFKQMSITNSEKISLILQSVVL